MASMMRNRLAPRSPRARPPLSLPMFVGPTARPQDMSGSRDEAAYKMLSHRMTQELC